MALKKTPKADLRRKYQRFVEVSLIIALILTIFAFKYFPDTQAEEVYFEQEQELVKMEEVAVTKIENRPPPPPRPLVPVEAPTDDVLDDIEIADTDLDVNEEVAAPPPPPAAEKKEEVAEEPVFFVAVEEMPEPIGGIKAIQDNIVYPDLAKKANVQGRVYVKAYVDEQGNVSKVELIKGIGAGCDEAGMDAVKKTKFKPGKQRGKPVKVQVAIPIIFKLQ
ncbi:MAG: energy transducer TonB [Ignavibacteria bacterium]|nr:energy transducer TonB [Ignavibacteria bacterium]